MKSKDTVEHELRGLADWCHNNQSSKTFEHWEWMSNKLCELADTLKCIENKAPLCRYGNIVINKVYVHSVDIGFGDVIMEGGVRHNFPSEVVKRWFADIADDSETIEAAKADAKEVKE